MAYGGKIYDAKTGKWLDAPVQSTGVGATPDQSLDQYLAQFGPESMGAGAVDPNSAIMNPVQEAPPAEDWSQIAAAYGLGAPPAVGMPASMQPIQLGPTPQTTPAMIDTTKIPQPVAAQLPVNDQIKAMSSGQGYAPDVLAKMHAGATQNAASAGLQELSQTKRTLGENGIRGGAAAGVVGDVARRTGQAQGSANRDIDINNAQVGNENAKFGLGLQTNIEQSNFQAVNSMALAGANALFEGMKSNQSSQNNADQMNTGLQFQRQNDQGTMDYNNQKSQWDELNKRFGQSQSILGSWGSAA